MGLVEDAAQAIVDRKKREESREVIHCKEAAARLTALFGTECLPDKVRRWCRDGKIEAYKDYGGWSWGIPWPIRKRGIYKHVPIARKMRVKG